MDGCKPLTRGKTRRLFSWPAPPGTDPVSGVDTLDDRPAASQVCFYASDKYAVTAAPYYCVEILLSHMPAPQDQVGWFMRNDARRRVIDEPNLCVVCMSHSPRR